MRFPTPTSICSLDFRNFKEIVSKLMGRRVHKEAKIAEIYALAQKSIALPISESSPAVATFRLQLERYLQLCHARAQLEAQSERLLQDRCDYQRLRSVPGIGPITALGILAEAGDLRRFAHHRQFLKFCGLDLAKSQSGLSRSRERLSRRGNARLRYALWQAALSAPRMRENPFRDKFQRYIASAPEDRDLRRKARTAVAAKMARVVHALVKCDRTFHPRFEFGFPSGSTPLSRAVEASSTSKIMFGPSAGTSCCFRSDQDAAVASDPGSNMVSRDLISAEDRWLDRLGDVGMYAPSPHQPARDAFASAVGLTANLDRCRCGSRQAGLVANRSHPERVPDDFHPCSARR